MHVEASTTVTHVGRVLTWFIINRSAQWCLSIVVNRGGYMVYDGHFGSSVAWYKHLTPYHKLLHTQQNVDIFTKNKVCPFI